MKRNYDAQFGGQPHENRTRGVYDTLWLNRCYREWLDECRGISDESITQMKWMDARGLFDVDRVEEFLDEQGYTDRSDYEDPRIERRK